MAKYFETTTENQDITALNGTHIDPTPLSAWMATHLNWSWYDKNSSVYYPSLVVPDHVTSASFSVDGNLTSQLVSGTHPPHRPK